MRKLIRDLAPGQEYAVQFRTNNGNDVVSEWSQVVRFFTTSDVTGPGVVQNLTLFTSGPTYIAIWDEVVVDENGEPLRDFRHYRVNMSDGIINKDFFVVGERFEMTKELNIATFGALRTSLTIKVWAVDLTYNESPTFATAVSTPAAPPVPSQPTVGNYLGLLSVSWNGKDLNGNTMPTNFLYCEVHISTTSNFVPVPTTLAGRLFADGNGSSITISGLTYGTTYYVRLVAVNAFAAKSAGSVQASGSPGRISGLDVNNNQISVNQINFTARDIGAAKAFYQTSQPTTGMVDGDVWFDTDDGYHQYVYSSGAWREARDTTIATAQSTASQASSDALAAAGLAASKGKVWYQTSAPTGNANDLWIDTTGGANTPKIWNGSAWVAVTDKVATDAAAAAAAAQLAANNAQTAANTAQTTANGKNKVTYSTNTPGTTANAAGDIWFQKNGSNVIIGEWEGLGGTSWSAKTIDNAVIANLDAGKITAGTISVDRLGALSITSDKIASNAITATKINAGAITSDAIGTNLIITAAANIGSAVIDSTKIGSVNAGTITVGTMQSSATVSYGGGASRPTWQLNTSGDAFLNNVSVRGQIVIGDVNDTLAVRSASIVRSSDYVANTSGWAIKGDGTAEFNSGTFRGTLSGATIIGSLFQTATAGRRVEIAVTGGNVGSVRFISPSDQVSQIGSFGGLAGSDATRWGIESSTLGQFWLKHQIQSDGAMYSWSAYHGITVGGDGTETKGFDINWASNRGTPANGTILSTVRLQITNTSTLFMLPTSGIFTVRDAVSTTDRLSITADRTDAYFPAGGTGFIVWERSGATSYPRMWLRANSIDMYYRTSGGWQITERSDDYQFLVVRHQIIANGEQRFWMEAAPGIGGQTWIQFARAWTGDRSTRLVWYTEDGYGGGIGYAGPGANVLECVVPDGSSNIGMAGTQFYAQSDMNTKSQIEDADIDFLQEIATTGKVRKYFRNNAEKRQKHVKEEGKRLAAGKLTEEVFEAREEIGVLAQEASPRIVQTIGDRLYVDLYQYATLHHGAFQQLVPMLEELTKKIESIDARLTKLETKGTKQ